MKIKNLLLAVSALIVCGNTFAEKTEEKYYDVFGPSAALAVMFNCI